MTYSPVTDKDVKDMLNTIKLNSLDELFDIVPEKFRLDYENFNVPEGYSEQEVFSLLNDIGSTNYAAKNKTFLGGGAYDHYVPKIVDFLASRSEFYTAYTPYQPEVSQGTLQYLYEFQTMICELSDMEIANASLYDGASAVAEACSMGISYTNKKTILLSSTLHPAYKELVEIYFNERTVERMAYTYRSDYTQTALEAVLSHSRSAGITQNPNGSALIVNIIALFVLIAVRKRLLKINLK